MRGKCLYTAFLVLILLLTPVASWGQMSGATLSGLVSDSSGALIPEATVTARNNATGVSQKSLTNKSGLYTIVDLEPGVYTVSVAAANFSTQVEKGIQLTVGGSRQLDVKLTIGDVSTRIEVTAGTADVETDTSVVSATVNQKRIVDLPLNGRDFTQLATLQPGVTTVRSQQSAGAVGTSRGVRGFGNELTVNGHSPYENNYRINGINENDYSNGAPGSPLGVNLGVDAIQEFSVVTSSYTAEYGRVSGAVINAVGRSGTNNVHGTAFLFDRDKIFDARNFFDTVGIAPPPFHRVQFGAALGGPIVKNRSFLFGNYEGIRQSQSTPFRNIVPSDAAKLGNIHTATGAPTTVAVNPNSAKYFGLFPSPNAGLIAGTFGDTGIFATSAASKAVEDFFTVRFDQVISEKDSVAFSYLFDDAHSTSPDSYGSILSSIISGRQVFTASENHTFGSSVVNVARLGFNRSLGRIFLPISASNPTAADTTLGFFPGLHAPQVGVTGLTTAFGEGGQRASQFFINSYQLYDDVVFVRGKHSIKVGFAAEQLRNTNQSLPQNGQVAFTSLANFLIDQPNSAIVPAPQTFPVEPTSNIFAGYVQDDWRVGKTLTVNVGARYEMLTIPYDRKNRLGYLNTLTAPAGSPACPVAIVPTTVPGCTVPVSQFYQQNPTLKNIEPRVGFSDDVFGNGHTAVRGSFGIYDILPLPIFPATYSGLSWPYSPDLSVTNALNGLPAGSFPNNIPAIAAASTANRIGHYVDQFPKRNYSLNYSLNIEQQYGTHFSSLIGYSGSHTLHGVFNAQDVNQVAPSAVQIINGRYVWPIGGTVQDTNVRNTYGFFFDNNAHYNGLISQLKVSGYKGLSAQGSYTWGQCMDYGSTTQSPTTYANSIAGLIYFDRAQRRGRCDYSITQTFTANAIYDFPSPKHSEVLKALGGGWQLGTIVFASTGTPFTIINTGDVLGQKNTSFSAFPDMIPNCNPYNAAFKSSTTHSYINANCFAFPTAPVGSQVAALCNQSGTAAVNGQVLCLNVQGNLRRNSLIGPRQVNADLSLIKNTHLPKLSEVANLQLRFEAFNFLNHANFQAPLNNLTLGARSGFLPTQGNVGIVDSTATTARQIQLGAKVVF